MKSHTQAELKNKVPFIQKVSDMNLPPLINFKRHCRNTSQIGIHSICRCKQFLLLSDQKSNSILLIMCVIQAAFCIFSC